MLVRHEVPRPAGPMTVFLNSPCRLRKGSKSTVRKLPTATCAHRRFDVDGRWWQRSPDSEPGQSQRVAMFGLPRLMHALWPSGARDEVESLPDTAAPQPGSAPACPERGGAGQLHQLTQDAPASMVAAALVSNIGSRGAPRDPDYAFFLSRDSSSPALDKELAAALEAAASASSPPAAASVFPRSAGHCAEPLGSAGPAVQRTAAASYIASTSRSSPPSHSHPNDSQLNSPTWAVGAASSNGASSEGSSSSSSSSSTTTHPRGTAASTRSNGSGSNVGGGNSSGGGGGYGSSGAGHGGGGGGSGSGQRGAEGQGGEEGGAGEGGAGRGGGVISVAELDGMLSGLRASLASIKTSKATLVALLAERDDQVLLLQAEAAQREALVQDLSSQLRSSQAQLQSTRSQINRAQEEAAAAREVALEAQAELKAVREELAAQAAALEQMQQLWLQQQQQQEQQQLQQQQQQQQRQVASSRAASPAPAAPPAPPPAPTPAPHVVEITIYYRSHWKQAFLHCNVDGKGWTAVPGLAMETAGDQFKVVRVPGQRMEFVLNNGRGEWDSPSGNYQVSSPGRYRLENGSLHRAQ